MAKWPERTSSFVGQGRRWNAGVSVVAALGRNSQRKPSTRKGFRERATGIEPAFSAWEVTLGHFRYLRVFAELASYQDFRVRRLPASDTEFQGTVRARIAHGG
jgi:hypothetical protein